MGVPVVDPLFEVGLLLGVELFGAPRHDVGVTGDNISHVEVVYSVCQQRAAQLGAAIRLVSKLGEAAILDHVVAHQVWGVLSETSSDLIKGIVRQRAAKLFRESSQDLPVVSCEAWSSACYSSCLNAAVQVDKSAHFL